MSLPEPYVRRCAEVLRRDRSVVAPLATAADKQEWRAGMRRVCRAAGLRVRTGLSADGDLAWAYHVDHVATEASRAASRAIEATLAGEVPPAPFHELVRHEQRKMLRLVPGQADED